MTKGRNGRRVIAVLAIAGLGLALTACGGDDDDDAAPSAAAEDSDTADNDDAESDNADDDNGDTAEAEDNDDDTIKVDDVNDIPDECLDVFKDFLKQIEPLVEDVDWENADLSAMEDIGSQLDSIASGMDEEMSDECDKYELADENNMDSLIELAKDEAPGTVGYFEFIKAMQEGFSDMTIPDVSIPDLTLPEDGDGGDAADLPTDCEGAKAYIEGLMDEFDSMMDMPVNQLSAVGTVTGTLTSACSPNELQDFMGDADVQSWMSGT